MGIAEAIPGVSGGTLAFITGIYEELLDTIKRITPGNIRLIFKDVVLFWRAINGVFLLWLLVGMGVGLVVGVFVISHLLETEKEILWALFFGLVLASAYYLGRSVRWSGSTIAWGVLGAILSYSITTFAPVSGNEHPLYLFISGCLAVSALMLPGISGSFILLLLGLYDVVIHALKDLISNQDMSGLTTLVIFGLGVMTGLFTFARLLSWLFKSYHNRTMALMIGILIGSLNKLWPWKKIVTVYNKDTGLIESANNTIRLPDVELYKIVSEVNLSPREYGLLGDVKLLGVILAFMGGVLIVSLLFRYSAKPSEV